MRKFAHDHQGATLGCLVDTSILFSVSYPLDKFNEEAAQVFDIWGELAIPVYTNANVRSEFLELHRRVMIPEGLIDFLEDEESSLDQVLVQKLKSLRTRFRRNIEEGKGFKLSDSEIKLFRHLMSQFRTQETDGWLLFCRHYLQGRLEPIWEQVVELIGLNFIGLRSGERATELVGQVSWKGTTNLMSKFGMGSTDAMILDLFFNSKFKMLLTSDQDMAYCVNASGAQGRYAFLPNLRAHTA